jgi:hypothetical protein
MEVSCPRPPGVGAETLPLLRRRPWSEEDAELGDVGWIDAEVVETVGYINSLSSASQL